MTTGGEGGMFVTDDEAIWRRAWAYKDHGKSWAATHESAHPPGFRWLHESFGTNWRMTEMQAAIGRRQLMKLDQWIARRTHNASIMAAALQNVPGLRIPPTPDWAESAHYKFYAFINPAQLRQCWDQTRIIQAVNAEGVPCFAGSCSEIYRERAFVDAGFAPQQRLPEATLQGETSLMFLVHPTLSDTDIEDACNATAKVMAVAVDLD